MEFHQPRNPISNESRILAVVSAAFKNSLDSPDACLIHGTSLFAVQRAIEEGCLPAGRHDSDGRLYFYNYPSRLALDGVPKVQGMNDKKVIQQASLYAHGAEFHVQAQLEFGIPIETPPLAGAISELSSDFLTKSKAQFQRESVFKPLRDHGVSYEQAFAFSEKWADMKPAGVLLAFSARVMEQFKLCEAEGLDDGLYIEAPQGLSLDLLTGIEPLSEEALAFFEHVQANQAP